MLPLPEGQTGEAWEPSKNNALPKIRERLIENYCHLVIKLFICYVENMVSSEQCYQRVDGI